MRTNKKLTACAMTLLVGAGLLIAPVLQSAAAADGDHDRWVSYRDRDCVRYDRDYVRYDRDYIRHEREERLERLARAERLKRIERAERLARIERAERLERERRLRERLRCEEAHRLHDYDGWRYR